MRRNYLPLFALCCLTGIIQANGQATTMAYYTPGTYTYTVPAGYVANITVQAWGGGGGGGDNNDRAKGGGGGGAFVTNTYANVPAGNYTIIVGAGGAPGENGDNSSYTFTGGTVTARGGRRGGNNGGNGGTVMGLAGAGSGDGGDGGDRDGNSSAGGGGGGSGIAAGAGGDAAGASAGAGGSPSGGAGGTIAGSGQNGSAPGGGGGGQGDGGAGSGSGGNGWVIVIVSSSPLPVELSAFQAALTGNAVALSWSTATELNNEKFIVESSTEGEIFSAIAEIPGAGTVAETRNYQFVHHTPASGVNYYRLKQVDFDGNFAYSKILAVEAVGQLEVLLFPNPTKDRIQVQYRIDQGLARFQLFDGLGRRIPAKVAGYIGNYEIVLPEGASAGTYWLKIERGGKVQTLPVVKE